MRREKKKIVMKKEWIVPLGLFATFGFLLYLMGRKSFASHSSYSSSQPPELPDARIMEEKVGEWVAKGYPPSLARKAVTWAREWSLGLTTRLGLPPEYAPRLYPKSLELAERWLQGIMGLFK